MSSFNSLVGAPLQFNSDFNAATGVQQMYGSFQINPAGIAQAQNRGSWFTVSRVGAGQYRVQVVGIVVQNNLVPVQSVGNGQPNGLIAEAQAWIVNETVKVQLAAANVLNIYTAKFDTSDNSFDIFTSTGAAGAAQTLVDGTTAARIFFTLSYKVVANLP